MVSYRPAVKLARLAISRSLRRKKLLALGTARDAPRARKPAKLVSGWPGN